MYVHIFMERTRYVRPKTTEYTRWLEARQRAHADMYIFIFKYIHVNIYIRICFVNPYYNEYTWRLKARQRARAYMYLFIFTYAFMHIHIKKLFSNLPV